MCLNGKKDCSGCLLPQWLGQCAADLYGSEEIQGKKSENGTRRPHQEAIKCGFSCGFWETVVWFVQHVFHCFGCSKLVKVKYLSSVLEKNLKAIA